MNLASLIDVGIRPSDFMLLEILFPIGYCSSGPQAHLLFFILSCSELEADQCLHFSISNLLGGRDAFQLDMTFLSTTLSGEPLRAIQDWLLLSPSDPLWTGLPHLSPMYNRFIDSGMDVSTFCEPSL